MDDLSTEITWKKRVGSWWEKCPEPWVFVLIILIGFLVVLFATFLAVVICDDPQWIYPRLGLETKSGKDEALKFLGFGMGGLLIALQALMSYRRVTAMEDAAKAQATGTEQGQRQERLKNAIEHLGYESDSVRLGGAYELFHLARDTPDLRQTVLDILCAHIRRTTGEPEYRKDYKQNPSEEIQSLLALLFVQKHEVFTGRDINLQGSWLNVSTLYKARLEKANLRGAQLHLAHLTRAQLHRADLIGAQLHGARLGGAQLHEAYLADAQLHGAHLIGAQLHGANLTGAQLHGANLTGAQLHGADLTGAQLHGADLTGAQLHEADLFRAQLHGASSNDLKYPYEPFEAIIKKRLGKDSDLSGAISAGGLTPEAIDCIGKGLPDEAAKRLREKLEAHIGPPESRVFGLPENSGASIGAYTEEEARQWIAEYWTALSAVPGGG